MKKLFANRTAQMNSLCALLMIVLLVLQFSAFWTYGENNELSCSLQSYIWFPADNTALTKHLEALVPGHAINSIIIMPLLVLVTAVLGIVLICVKPGQPHNALLPVACGAVGVWGYLSKAEFQLGAGWQLHLALCILIALCGLLSLIMSARGEKQ